MPDNDPLEHSRVTLPKNLSETLKRLEDAELVTLLREVTTEAERRGVMKAVNTVATPKIASAAKYEARQSSGAPVGLPAGKANLIKASHSTGMKPAAIARMFRLSQSVVNRVLDLPAKSKRKSVYDTMGLVNPVTLSVSYLGLAEGTNASGP